MTCSLNITISNINLIFKLRTNRLISFADNFQSYVESKYAQLGFSWSLMLWTTSCSEHDKRGTYNHYCRSCHLVPNVNSLQRSICLSSVPPNIGAWMEINSIL
jgi:hypothetical protein